VGGIMTYDFTDIDNITYVEYVNNRNFSANFTEEMRDAGIRPPENAGDIGPEHLKFVSDDVYGEALLLVSNPNSASITMYSVDCGEPTTDPTTSPSVDPTTSPSVDPTTSPSVDPTTSPTKEPTKGPTSDPTKQPTAAPPTYSTTSTVGPDDGKSIVGPDDGKTTDDEGLTDWDLVAISAAALPFVCALLMILFMCYCKNKDAIKIHR